MEKGLWMWMGGSWFVELILDIPSLLIKILPWSILTSQIYFYSCVETCDISELRGRKQRGMKQGGTKQRGTKQRGTKQRGTRQREIKPADMSCVVMV